MVLHSETSGLPPVTLERRARDPLRYGRVVVIGGGCYGRWYTQQLARAADHGALIVDEVVVVDRDPACQVSVGVARGEFGMHPVRVEVAAWTPWLAAWLDDASISARARDMIVPSPLMPHLLLEWLVARAEGRWPSRAVSVEPLARAPDMPWERASPDGRHYVSFADWMCPVNCIEPARCPATKGARDWSMPPALAQYVSEEQARGNALAGPIIFHCEHRTWGVGMIDAASVVAADAFVADHAAAAPLRVLVGTVSHCHGALGVLHVQ